MGKDQSTSGDVIQIRDEYYILASSSLADPRTRVLKQGETFAVFDRYGDVHPVGRGQQGLYHDATRFLSRLELRLGRDRPLLLSSTVTEDNTRVAVDLTNPFLDGPGGGSPIPQDVIHVFRSVVLWNATCHQRIRVHSYALHPIRFELALHYDADFADIFEVRGIERAKRGQLLEPVAGTDEVVLGYCGLDGLQRRTRLRFAPAPEELDGRHARFSISLEPRSSRTLSVSVACEMGDEVRPQVTFDSAVLAAGGAFASRAGPCLVETTNERFNDWLDRSGADMRMMLTDTRHGPYPYAGLPWFDAPFGRDGIVTALETLWIDPAIARAVLRFLAATQADREDPASDAEPGKILHESRGGEMSTLGEVPFHRYYGTVDATPLFVVLAGAYHDRTGDLDLLEQIWPNLLRALDWIERYGDRDGDGFVEYGRRTSNGLLNQGWKDSQDSVSHADGRLADGPIALCEVQGYVYAAWQSAAMLASELGDEPRARALRARADTLQEQFDRRFWLEDIGTYALALDGAKQPCRVRSSNAGHCLWSGISRPERAASVTRTLLDEDSFSGWGIRTLAEGEVRYNPISYHNGSVWPHDNAIIAAGFGRWRQKEAVVSLLGGLFEAALSVDLARMPELFCGFPRRPHEGPTRYPVACAPQAWSAGAVYLLLQACLGLEIRGRSREVVFHEPVLPPFLERIRLRGLRVGEDRLDLDLVRNPHDVGIEVVQRSAGIRILTYK